ncbi:MAG: glycosyltransferase family A protein [Phormidesmis sp.]
MLNNLSNEKAFGPSFKDTNLFLLKTLTRKTKMLIFIIPVKSKLVSNSWSNVSALFERTLRSICNQTSSNFKVIVVCHERPYTSFEHESIKYIEADFSPPDLHGLADDPTEGRRRKEADHKRKLWLGSVHAESLNPSHIMFVDADDCISRKLASHVDKDLESSGWYISQGFEYPDNGQTIYPKSKFYMKSGTSSIIRYDLLKPLLAIQPDKIEGTYLSHKLLPSYFQENGSPLTPLPFRGAVYITGHGDNNFLEYFSNKQKNLPDLMRLYGGRLRKLLVAMSVTQEMQDEFYLQYD